MRLPRPAIRVSIIPGREIANTELFARVKFAWFVLGSLSESESSRAIALDDKNMRGAGL